MRILVVDDHEDLRKDAIDAVFALRAEMPEVEVIGEAADGLEAILAIERLKPDLVLLDVEMPRLDGFEVVAHLGADPPAVIFITGYEEYALRAFEVSAADFIVKPVSIERLKRAVERARFLRKERTPFEAVQQNERVLDALQQHRYLRRIVGRRAGLLRPVLIEDIYAFIADWDVIFALTAEGKWQVDRALTALEVRLDPHHFVRANRGIIVNLAHITQIERSVMGKTMLRLTDGSAHRISRRGSIELQKRLEY